MSIFDVLLGKKPAYTGPLSNSWFMQNSAARASDERPAASPRQGPSSIDYTNPAQYGAPNAGVASPGATKRSNGYWMTDGEYRAWQNSGSTAGTAGAAVTGWQMNIPNSTLRPVVRFGANGQPTIGMREPRPASTIDDWRKKIQGSVADANLKKFYEQVAANEAAKKQAAADANAAQLAAVMGQFDTIQSNAAQRFAQQRELADSFGGQLGSLVDRLRGEMPGQVANLQGIYSADTADTRAAITSALPDVNTAMQGTMASDTSMAIRGIDPAAIQAIAAQGGQWAGQAAGAVGQYGDQVVETTNRYGGDAAGIADSVMAAARSQVEANRGAMLNQLLGQENDLMTQLGLQRAQAEQSQYNTDREFQLAQAQLMAKGGMDDPAANNAIVFNAVDSAKQNLPSDWSDQTRFFADIGLELMRGGADPVSAWNSVLAQAGNAADPSQAPSSEEQALILQYLNRVYGQIAAGG